MGLILIEGFFATKTQRRLGTRRDFAEITPPINNNKMENINTQQTPLQQMILHSLGIMKKASADEIAMEIMEERGITSEEEVAELVIETKEELEKLLDAGIVKKIKPHREKTRYVLN